MIDLNNEKTRQQLVRQYLNAETTLEEERLLADILSDSDTALSTEEEDVLLLLQASRLIDQTDVTTEKADEFDRLMHKGRNKKGRLVAICWVAPVAAAIVCALLLFPTVHTDRTKEKQEVAMAAPAQTVVKPRQDTADADANKPALLAERKLHDTNAAKPSWSDKAGQRLQRLTTSAPRNCWKRFVSFQTWELTTSS